MIFTLGINSVLLGIMTLFTGGGFAPGDNATPFMSWLGVGRTLGVANPLLVWLATAAVLSLVLRKTVLAAPSMRWATPKLPPSCRASTRARWCSAPF